MTTLSEIVSAGGAYVRRPFTLGQRIVANGDVLSATQVRAIPKANLRALISLGKIEPLRMDIANEAGRMWYWPVSTLRRNPYARNAERTGDRLKRVPHPDRARLVMCADDRPILHGTDNSRTDFH